MRTTLTSLLLAAAMAACAHGPALSTHERLSLYRQHAGPPVASFRFDRTTGMQNWTPLGDQALMIWSDANSGHLLELRTRCPAILTAPRVSLTSWSGEVDARLDSVVALNASGSMVSVCRFSTIRPVDGASLRDAQLELREYDVIERTAAPSVQSPSND
jgi:hypothetical protein